jgi:hypothetical protein
VKRKSKSLEQLEKEADEAEIYLPARERDLKPEQRVQYRKEHEEQVAREKDPIFQRLEDIAFDQACVDWNYWGRLKTLSAMEFVVLRHTRDPNKFEEVKNNFPEDQPPTLERRVSKDLRMIEADPEMQRKARLPLAGWVAWAHKNSLWCPEYLLAALPPPPAKGGDGIKPGAFTRKYESKITGGSKFLKKWFNGSTRAAGEKPAARKYMIRRGLYDERAMVEALKHLGRYTGIGD